MEKLIICVPSYKRPKNFLYEKVIQQNPECADRFVYFVREEEFTAYQNAMPLLPKENMVSIPKGWVTGVGSTREFIRKFMSGMSLNWYTISDDDITSLVQVRYDTERKAHYDGKDLSKTLTVIERILSTLPENCAIGSPQPRAFAKDFDIPVKVMSTRSPSQIIFYNNQIVKNIPFNLDLFDKHGDDIGYACQVVAAGYDYFQIPQVVYSCWDSTFSGILRTKETYRALFNQDYENAKRYLPEQCLGRSKNDYHFTYIKPKEVLRWRKE